MNFSAFQFQKPFRVRAGFTILELMAATAVFALMLVFTLQMITRTNTLSTQTSKQIESVAGARTALDAIARDMRTMVRTQGFTFVGGRDPDNSNNAYISFLCQGRPSSSMDPASMAALRYTGVCYRVFASSGTDSIYLLRMQTGVPPDPNIATWGSNTITDLQNTVNLYTKYTPTTAQIPSFLVSDKVIRMEMAYIWKDGSITKDVKYDLSASNSTYPAGSVDLSKLSSIAIGLVTLDQKSQDLLKASGISSLANLFAPVGDDQLPLDVWKGTDLSSQKGPVKTGVRYLQRIIPVN